MRFFSEQFGRSLRATYLGISDKKGIARLYFWWPKIDRDIENFAQNCELLSCSPSKAKLSSWPWPETSWPRIHVDFCGPISKIIFF